MRRKAASKIAAAPGLLVYLSSFIIEGSRSLTMQPALTVPSNQTWSHATNTRAQIEAALAGDGVHFIEADVCYDDSVGPYMAHTVNDLKTLDERRDNAFANWLDYLNARRQSPSQPGLKLDFKMAAAVGPCLAQLRQARRYPLWLNADILQGPRGAAPVFEADDFIRAGLAIADATLSLGWTTGDARRGLDPIGYSHEMIDQMLAICHPSLLDRDVTFPVRAVDAVRSPDQLHHLLSHSSRWSLTFWNGREGVLPDEQRQLRSVFDGARTYIDLVRTEGD